MPIAQYQIPDTLNINKIWGSGNNEGVQAYTKISSYNKDSGTSKDAVWLLPLPNQLTYNSEYKWSAEELHQVAGDIIQEAAALIKGDKELSKDTGIAIATKAGLAISQKATRDFIANKIQAENSNAVLKEIGKQAGVAYNPNEQLYFDGVSLRDFDMDFTITPTSKEDARNISGGFFRLRRLATPSYKAEKFFFTYPPSFTVSVIVSGVTILERPNVVITALNLNMNPNGPLTWHDDGFPTSLSCSIMFKEQEVPTQENIAKIKLFGI